MCAMKLIVTALLVLVALAPAYAQGASPPPAPSAATPPRPPPPVQFDPWNRGPPLPPERPYVQPGPQVAPPMERITPVAPLSPRVGN